MELLRRGRSLTKIRCYGKVTLGVIPVSLLGLPMMHVLVVTQLFGCVEIEIIALFLSWHEGD